MAKYLCKWKQDEIQNLTLVLGPTLKMCEIVINGQERSNSEKDIRVQRKRNAKDLRGLITIS